MTNKIIPTKEKPGFGIITPTAYLQRYANQSRFHLVLAHLVEKDQKYADFYLQKSNDGDFIIMDNGAFELGQSYEPAKLIGLAQQIKADAIVLPDYPGQPAKKTVDAAIALGNEVKDNGFKTVFVPQSERGNLEDWIKGYEWAAATDWIDIIGMSILGIPNALSNMSRVFARVAMAQVLLSRGYDFNKYHHWLGLNSVNELPSLLSMNVLNSCDSSNPVWCGINGLRYNVNSDSYMPISKKYLREVDFNQPMTRNAAIHEAIVHNLGIVQEIMTAYLRVHHL